ncbi:hypothetical protein [Methanocaldococcus sp.]
MLYYFLGIITGYLMVKRGAKMILGFILAMAIVYTIILQHNIYLFLAYLFGKTSGYFIGRSL